MAVPNTFATDTGTIPLSQLDANFAYYDSAFNIAASTMTIGYNIVATGTVSGVGFSNYLASPPAIGSSTPAAGSFTTLSASSTVSGVGFSSYLASPPAIGSVVPSTGAFTTLSASSTVSGTGFSTYLASPPDIGGTAAAAGTFTTLSATANAVTSVNAKSLNLTSITAVTGSLTLATGGITLASQSMATNAVWRVTAYGNYVAASSANSRALSFACFWGSTALTAIGAGTITPATARTTPWRVEFEITGTSTTAAWVTSFASSQVASGTIALNYVGTPTSVTGLTTTSTLDFRVGQTGTATAGDTINVYSVVIERIA